MPTSQIYLATKTLTDAQIKTLPNVPISILDPLGAGKFIIPLVAVLILDNAAGAYTNVHATSSLFLVRDPAVGFNVDSVLANSDFLTAASPERVTSLLGGGLFLDQAQTRVEAITQEEVANRVIGIGADNATLDNFTGGNSANHLDVYMFYVIVEP